MHKSQRVKITDLNPHLICVLCSGYLIDATTIIECLHSFCRTCIVKYLENNKYCPICDVQVHKTKPLLNIRSDQTLQDIVYKLVPGLFQNEMCRRRDFYAKHPERKPAGAEESGEVTQFSHIYTADESVSLSLEYYNNNIPYDNIDNNKKEKLETAIRRYFRCPAAVSVTDLQKLIRSKYALTTEHRVDIMYMNDKLCEELTLMDIAYIYLWRRKVPLHLTYRIYKVVKKIKLNDTDTKDVKTDDINNKTLSGHTEWKEVQLQISENGEMYATNIDETKLPDSQPDLLEVKTEGPPDVTVPEIKVPEIPELTPIQPKIEVKEEIKEEPKVEKTDDNEVKLGKHKLAASTDSSESSAKKPNIPIVKPLVKNVQQLSPNHPLKIHSQLIIKPATVTSSAVKLVQTQPKTTMSKMNNNNNNNSMKPPPLNSVDKKHVVTTAVANHQPIPKLVTPKTTVQNSQCLEKSVKIPQNCSSPSPISTATTPVPVPTNSAKECEKTIIPLPNIPRYTQAGHSTETTTTTMKLSENSIQKYPISNSSPPVVISNNCIQSSKVSIVPKKPTVKIGTPIGYKTLRDPPKAWNPQISRQTLAKTNVFNVNNGASTSDSSKAENKTQTKPAKFFKMRNNMPRFLGNPASGVKPMFHVRDGDKSPPDAKKAADATKKVENKTNNNNEKTTEKKVEVKKQQSIIKIDPKTLRPISDKPETASCSEVPEMKINQSTVPIFNPLRTQKSQTSPKIDRRSPKSPYLDTSQKSPVERNSPKTNKPLNSPTSKKDKLSLNFTPANPFIPNLTSPNLAPNQFLYSNFPSYDPRVMNNLSAYHNLPFSMYFTQPRLNYPGLASQNMPISPNLMSSLNLEVNKRKNYEIPAMLQLSPTLDMKKSVTNTKTSSSKDCDEKSETKTKSNSNNKPTGTVEKIPEVEADKTSTNKEEIRVKPPETSEINTEVKIIETVAEKVKEPEVVPKENNVKEEKCTKKEDGGEKENPNDTKVPLTVEPVKST